MCQSPCRILRCKYARAKCLFSRNSQSVEYTILEMAVYQYNKSHNRRICKVRGPQITSVGRFGLSPIL